MTNSDEPNILIPEAAAEAAAKSFYGTAWDDCSPEDLEYELGRMRETLEAAAPHMETERAVKLRFTSRYSPDSEVIAITSLEDLEALAIKHGEPLVITVGEDGKLSSVEVYDDYRE